MFDRLVCMNGGNPRPDLIDKKDTLKAQALERSPRWKELSKNHLAGRTAAFFCYGDAGSNEVDESGKPIKLTHPEWFDAAAEPFRNREGGERLAYEGLVWQCRYSDIEVPDALWRHAVFGAGKPYADDQAADMMKEQEPLALFDRWAADFVTHVEAKGLIPDIADAEKGAETTTNKDKKKVQ
jgi:hypothetical protein